MADVYISEVAYGRYVANITDGGKVIEMSKEFTALTGYSEEDMEKGVLFTDFLPEEDRAEYIATLKKIEAGEIGSYLKHRFVCKDGRVMVVLCFGDEYFDDNGNKFTRITICDVTQSAVLEKEFEKQSVQLEVITESVPCGLVLYEVDGANFKIIRANKEYYRLFGYESESEHPGAGGQFFKRPESESYRGDAVQTLHEGKAFVSECRYKLPDGSFSWMSLRLSSLGKNKSGNNLVSGVFVDINERKKNEAELIKQAEKMRLLSENTNEIFFEYDVKADRLMLTNCFNRYAEGSNIVDHYVSEKKYEKYTHPDDVQEALKVIKESMHSPQKNSIQMRTKAFDKEYSWYKLPFVSVADESGSVSNIYGRIYSIDHMQKLKSRVLRDRAEIERLTNTDPTTGLLTRNAFKETVAKYLSKGLDPNCCYAIVYSDINDFSYVNDNFGFDAGNQMLRDFAITLTAINAYVTGCRVYSDYFAVFAKANSREELIECIKTSNNIFNNNQHKRYPASDLHISSGMYVLPNADVDVVIAMDNADLARKSVKGIKEITCGIYAERMRSQRSHDQAIAAELKNALNSGQIELFLQPKFSLDTRELRGAEALSRWRNSDGTYKLPYEFISVLEKVGYIIDLDMYMFETLLSTMSKWRREGIELFPVSINFSRNHAGRKDFVERLTALADFYNIETSLLEIEITESALMQDFNALYNDMKRLRERGFKIDIDDFGMGYSSLSVLLNAPIDIVKVDKIFIDNIVSSNQARDYVNQMCTLINLTNKSIIFEGVETEAQAQILASSGHKLAQGWLFDKAISVPEFERKYLGLNNDNKAETGEEKTE